MTVTITRNGERLASYHYKRTDKAHKAIKALTRFYKGLYPSDDIKAVRAR